jgi:hypothetical protein
VQRADHSSRRVLPECGVTECDRESSIMMRPWLLGMAFKKCKFAQMRPLASQVCLSVCLYYVFDNIRKTECSVNNT